MRIGWRQFVKQRLKRPSKYFSVGIELGLTHLHLAVLRKSSTGMVWTHKASLPIDNWQQQLKTYISDQGLDNTRCHVALSTHKYQLLQVDRPAVSDGEISQALTWSVKDLVSIQGDLVVDYFDLPAQSAGSNKINAVAASKKDIEDICLGVAASGLQLQSISAAEVATCDLLCDREDAVMTLLQVPGQEICLNIVKKGQLYFSRHLRGYENLASFNEQELQMGIGDNLSVEIQRSLDYFESQLRQAPVKKILLGLDSPHTEKLSSLMQQLTFMPTEALQIDMQSNDGFSLDCASFVSMGAAFAERQGMEAN